MRYCTTVKDLLLDKLSVYRSTTAKRFLSRKYLHGNGLEIGALHNPLGVYSGAHVLYVDRKPVDELRRAYPELESYSIVNVDILDDGEHLNTIGDSSVDFVIANHFLEHCEDPITTIETFIRVLRPGGVLFLTVPDKRHTFDKDRCVTSLEHLIADYGRPIISREHHFKEFEEYVQHEPAKRDYSIHYHVWTDKELVELLAYMERDKGLRISTIKVVRASFENIFLVRKLQ